MFLFLKRIYLIPQKILRSSLRTKLLIIYVLLTILPLSIVGITSYFKAFSTVWDNTASSTLQIADQLNKNVETLFTDSEKFLEIGKDPSAVLFTTNYKETYAEAKYILKLFTLYRNSYKFSQSIRNISLIGINGKSISERRGVYYVADQKLFSDLVISSLLKKPNEIQIIASDSPDNSGHKSIFVGSALSSEVTREIYGVIIVELDASIIEEFCKNMKIGKTGYFYVLDKNSTKVFMPSEKTILEGNKTIPAINFSYTDKGNFVEKVGSKSVFVVYNTSTRTGWKIVGEANLKDLMKDAYDIRNITLISVVLCVVFAVILYFYISGRLTLPIRDLKDKMKQASLGDFEVKVESENSDEIADLGVSFNKMLLKMKVLLENIKREQENLKKSEFKTLQAQINPHFLYNTLSTIEWMTEAKRNDEVVEMVSALTSFFRITLSKGKDWITIADEIEHVRSYLMIQKVRYRDILDYEIDIDDELKNYRILKLSIQPLVENSLYHGIKNKRGGGFIRITGRMYNNSIQIKVNDNGQGIPAERLEAVKKELGNESFEVDIKESGFGLSNVHKRIQLYSGKDYGLRIMSEYNIGTTVIMTIPLER